MMTVGQRRPDDLEPRVAVDRRAVEQLLARAHAPAPDAEQHDHRTTRRRSARTRSSARPRTCRSCARSSDPCAGNQSIASPRAMPIARGDQRPSRRASPRCGPYTGPRRVSSPIAAGNITSLRGHAQRRSGALARTPRRRRAPGRARRGARGGSAGRRRRSGGVAGAASPRAAAKRTWLRYIEGAAPWRRRNALANCAGWR